jgi:hypothetical protein
MKICIASRLHEEFEFHAPRCLFREYPTIDLFTDHIVAIEVPSRRSFSDSLPSNILTSSFEEIGNHSELETDISGEMVLLVFFYSVSDLKITIIIGGREGAHGCEHPLSIPAHCQPHVDQDTRFELLLSGLRKFLEPSHFNCYGRETDTIPQFRTVSNNREQLDLESNKSSSHLQ